MLPGNQSGNDWAFPGAEGTLRGGPNIARRGIFGPGRPPRPSAGAAFQGYRGGAIQRGTRRSATALPSAPADGPSVIITSSRSSVLGNAPERSGERESEAGATLAPIPQGGVGSWPLAGCTCNKSNPAEPAVVKAFAPTYFQRKRALAAGYQNAE